MSKTLARAGDGQLFVAQKVIDAFYDVEVSVVVKTTACPVPFWIQLWEFRLPLSQEMNGDTGFFTCLANEIPMFV